MAVAPANPVSSSVRKRRHSPPGNISPPGRATPAATKRTVRSSAKGGAGAGEAIYVAAQSAEEATVSLVSAIEDAERGLGSTPGRHVMRVLHPKDGDLKITWDPENAEEVKVAHRSFDDLRAKGMVAYRVSRKGEKTEVVDKFDKDAEAMILAPAVRGG